MSLRTPRRRTPSFSADAGVTERAAATAAKAATKKVHAMKSSRSRRHDLGARAPARSIGPASAYGNSQRSRLPCIRPRTEEECGAPAEIAYQEPLHECRSFQ